uniref:magnesium chelatase n=1 Tax=Kalanchoe fedtschenkoi TaxID=63787 RepID=A0A7N0U3Y7_KALFE
MKFETADTIPMWMCMATSAWTFSRNPLNPNMYLIWLRFNFLEGHVILEFELGGIAISGKRGTTKTVMVIFVVDASGSMALNCMQNGKGATLKLLAESYTSRDQVSIIPFRGDAAEVLLPPFRSIAMARNRLEKLPCGGVVHWTFVGCQSCSECIRVMIVAITVGRTNISLIRSNDPEAAATADTPEPSVQELKDEIFEVAGKICKARLSLLVVIDTENKFVSTCFAEEIARVAQDLPIRFEDRVAAVGIATQFQGRSKEVFKMREFERCKISREQLKYLVLEAIRGFCQGHRAELYAARVAKCLAAVEDEKVTVDDLKKSFELVILPRSNINENPPDPQNQQPPPPPPPPSKIKILKMTKRKRKRKIRREKDIQKTRKVFVVKTDMRAKRMAWKGGALIEVNDVNKEMDLELIKQYSQAERIIADRISKEGSGDVTIEYMVKWQGLSYADATWKKQVKSAITQEAIDECKIVPSFSVNFDSPCLCQAREASVGVQGAVVDFQCRRSKGSWMNSLNWLRGGKLRDYQLEGLNFLVNSWINDTNVILADEMGLGKTVQSVSMLGFLKNSRQIPGPFLVVVPLSTLSNWAKEFKEWLPDMNVIVYVGIRASREICQQYEFFTEKKSVKTTKFNAPLTTYEVVLKDKAILSTIRWNYLLVDEAHRLKNCEAQLYTTLLEFFTENKLLITGTPLQNNVEDLWALLHFLDPPKFRNKDDFVQNYKNLSSFNEKEVLLRPHILRRVIKESLPPKIERIMRVDISPLQKQYYKWILERNLHDLNKRVRGNQNGIYSAIEIEAFTVVNVKISQLNIVVELKNCCNHPFLFESVDHGYGGHRMILSSGQLVILDKLLLRLHETNHRVLIFS